MAAEDPAALAVQTSASSPVSQSSHSPGETIEALDEQLDGYRLELQRVRLALQTEQAEHAVTRSALDAERVTLRAAEARIVELEHVRQAQAQGITAALFARALVVCPGRA